MTGYEDWELSALRAFIEAEQDNLRAISTDLYNREWSLRRAIWELEKRMRKAV